MTNLIKYILSTFLSKTLNKVISQLSVVVVVFIVMCYPASFALSAHFAFSIFLPDMLDEQRSVSSMMGTVEELTLCYFCGRATQTSFLLVYTSVLYIYTITNIFHYFYSYCSTNIIAKTAQTTSAQIFS